MQNSLIEQQLGHLTLGEAQWIHNLSVYPLLADEDNLPGYLTLDQALDSKQARITEVTEGGHVPELAFENLTDQPILLLDGEELVGAKQNRVLNVTLLVLGGSKLMIPVSCVEMGRWSHNSPEFSSGGRAMYSRARAGKMAQVNASLRRSGSRESDQGAIWDDIAFKMNERGETSSTQAMADIYAGAEGKLSDYEQAFQPIPRQVGAVFAINGQIAGIELFDAPAALAAYLPKLVNSYALDALDARQDVPLMVESETIRRFLKQLGAATQERYPASGAGEDVRLEGEVITGGALEHGGKLIHLAAFRTSPKNRATTGERVSPMARSAYRRRLH
jgi:hypothetical protein